MVKLLKISEDGLMLFKGRVDIDFYAEQRVLADNNEMLFNPFGKIYINNVLSIVGINASGKTSLLKLISFIISLVNGVSINSVTGNDILSGTEKAQIESIFYNDKVGVCKLVTKIDKVIVNELESRYVISEEQLYVKKISSIKTKKDLVNFSVSDLYKERDNSAEFLQDDTSIAIALSKTSRIYMDDLIDTTNRNHLQLIGNFPHELIAFLDPSIEKLEYDKLTHEAVLKFYGRDEIRVANPLVFERYLSSGTIKGINVFISAMVVFTEGGYLLVDELENHFNREIVATLIRFFMNKKVNCNGATLVFSTHYSELLDEFDRNDNIYIVRNRGGVSAQKLCDILKRNDIKKSEAFKSDFLEGTVPSYDSYMDLKRAIINNRISEG